MPEGRLSETIRTYLAVVEDEDAAHRLAGDLAARGHRLVRIRRIPGDPARRRVQSLVDEPAAGWAEEDHQAELETVAIGALARRYGGYHESGATSRREDADRFFGTEDVVRELDPPTAHAIRRELIAGFPPPRPAPEPDAPLGCPPPATVRRLFDVIRAVAPDNSWWRSPAADAFAGTDEVELVFEISDSFMHQGSCYDHTATEVPLIAALAARDDVHPALRATLIHFLFLAATAGRRLAAADVDRRRTLGMSLDEGAAERAAREAVEAAAPALLARWDEPEAVCFSLAMLAAACAGPGRGLAEEIRDWGESEGTATPRGRVLGLAAALAGEDPVLDVMLAGMVADGFTRRAPSPAAPAPGAAFTVLEEWAEKELSGVLEGV